MALKLAHDDNENNKVSALKILNDLALDMGQTLNESFIVPEVKSLGIEESILVRQEVARSLLNVSKVVSIEYFSSHIFPLYDKLT